MDLSHEQVASWDFAEIPAQVRNASGVPAFLRRPRGRDIYAACGQLKRTLE